MNSKIAISLFAAAFLSACGVHNYELVEPSNLVQAPKLSQAPWYSSFNDSRLNELIATALENNEDIKIALNSLEIAKTFVDDANIARWPHVDLTASAATSKAKNSPSNQHYSISAGLSWQLDFWGALSKKEQKAKLSAEQSELALAKSKDLIAFAVARLYYQIAASILEERIMSEFSTLQAEQLKIFENQLKLGAISSSNFAKLQSDYEKIKIREKSAKAKTKKLCEALGALVYPINSINLMHINANIPDIKAPEIYLSTQLLNRPDVASAALEVAKRHLDAKIALTSFFPSFSLTLSESVAGSSDIFSNPATSLGINLLQPLFNLAANKAALKRANLSQDSAVLEYEKLLKNAIIELRKMAISYQNDSENLERFQKVIELEQDVFNTAKMRYEVGETSLLDYMDAKHSLLSSKLEANNLALSKILSVINLYDASGIRQIEESALK